MKRKDSEIERIIDIGLDIKSINLDILKIVLDEAERSIRKHLIKSVGLEYLSDVSVVLKAEVIDDKVTFIVDVSFSAPRVLTLDYEKTVDEAIEKAFETIERRLRLLGKRGNKGEQE